MSRLLAAARILARRIGGKSERRDGDFRRALKARLRSPPPPAVLDEFRRYSHDRPQASCLEEWDRAAARLRAWDGARGYASRAAEEIRRAVDERRPFSLVRVGDGEGNLLFRSMAARYPTLDAYSLARISDMHFGDPDTAPANADLFARLLAEAIAGADILGLPDRARLAASFAHPPDPSGEEMRGACGVRGVFHALADEPPHTGQLGVPAFVNRALLPHYIALIGGLDFLGVISGHAELAPRLKAMAGVRHVEAVAVPMQATRTRGGDRAEPHYPAAFERIMASVRPPRRGAVYFVAAGILAKAYCQAIKARGGVALDIGSAADAWMGLRSRPGMTAESLERWRLPAGAQA
jgi:hypothetical protein